MFPRILMLALLLVFVPQPQNQNPQDCKEAQSQLADCRRRHSSCEEKLRDANSDCQKKLQNRDQSWQGKYNDLRSELSRANNSAETWRKENAALETQLRQALNNAQSWQKQYGEMKTQLTQAQNSAQSWQNQYGEMKTQLTLAQNSAQSWQNQFGELKTELTRTQTNLKSSEGTAAVLRDQNAQLKTSYENQLMDKERNIQAKSKEIDNKNNEISRLNAMNIDLKTDMRKLGASVKSAEEARGDAERAKTALEQQYQSLSDEQKKKPEVVMEILKQSQNEMDQTGAPTSIVQGQGGSIKRELVIGTLEVKPYPAEIPSEGKLQLIAIFTPRPLPGGLAGDGLWYVNLVYNPPPGINAVYNQQHSLGEEVREIHIGTEHKWVWIVDAPKDSQPVLSATQMDILAGFQKDKVERIAGQPVVLTRGKPKPGFFAQIFAFVKENLTYILATITTLFGIWAAFLTIKLKKVELAKTERIEAPSP
jgi:predicted nuclease with TOPRIM domain